MKLAKSAVPENRQMGITITLSLSMLLASLGTSIANIALPALSKAFSAPFAQVQAVVVSYLAAMTISVLITGRLGDKHGLKPMLIVGLGLFAVASLLCSAAPNLWALIGARVLQGIGAAFLMTLVMAMMRQTVSNARVGRAMGLLGTVSALGTAIGPSLGGLLLQAAGWHSIFWIQVPFAILALILAITTLENDSSKEKTLAPSLWSVMNAKLLPHLSINFLVAAVMMTTLVVGPFYLGLALGLKEALVGIVMAIGPVISIFSGVPSGRLVDAWGSDRVLSIGLVLLIVGAILLATLPNMIGVAGYVFSIIALTPGYQLCQAANNTLALADAPKDRSGTVSGLLNLSRNLGLIAGASIMGMIFAWGVGTEDFAHAAPTSISNGMRQTFLLAGAMMIVALAITITRTSRGKEAAANS